MEEREMVWSWRAKKSRESRVERVDLQLGRSGRC